MFVLEHKLLIFAFITLILFASGGSVRFTAITDVRKSYVNKLYLEEWNDDAPSELDPAAADPSMRQQICEDISNSGVLAGSSGRKPVRKEKMYAELKHPRYYKLFHRIYSPKESQCRHGPQYEYSNPYKLRDVKVSVFFPLLLELYVQKTEYVFACLVKEIDSQEDDSDNSANSGGDDVSSSCTDYDGVEHLWTSDEDESDGNNGASVSDEGGISPNADVREDIGMNEANAYKGSVEDDSEKRKTNSTDDEEADNSKKCYDSNLDHGRNDSSNDELSYRIVPFYVSKAYHVNRGLHVHRFLFWDNNKSGRLTMLAEGSAKVHARSDFNVELHYLELRKHHESVLSYQSHLDPVAKLNLGSKEDRQLFRLCAIVLTASNFKHQIEYPDRRLYKFYSYSKVSFRTAEGRENAAGKSYKELTLVCSANMIDGSKKLFYISRAYNPHEVFLYVATPSVTKIGLYLESLITNVHIVHEPHYFGEVEV